MEFLERNVFESVDNWAINGLTKEFNCDVNWKKILEIDFDEYFFAPTFTLGWQYADEVSAVFSNTFVGTFDVVGNAILSGGVSYEGCLAFFLT